MSYMIGVDVGGTFTDFSVFDQESGELFHYKDSSTPSDPSRAIIQGILSVLAIKKAEAASVGYLAHGTTVGTNALIEKKGARVGLITTKGFKDLMEIGNQRRPSLYNLQAQKPFPLIPSGLNCTVTERIRYDGTIDTPLDEEETRQVVRYLKEQQVTAIAVCTLFSFVNPVHELRIEEIIQEEFPEAYVTISSKLVPEFREYSRMSTTVLNSYLGPVMKKYVNNFRDSVEGIGIRVEPYVTQSNGSIISIKETVDCPIKTAVSGPSAGVIAAAFIGRQCGADKIITFDMGGTSADISLIENFTPQVSNEREVEGYPARIPMINIITIGAGGGSIAKIDEGGALKVGPKSAGATPGPACYIQQLIIRPSLRTDGSEYRAAFQPVMSAACHQEVLLRADDILILIPKISCQLKHIKPPPKSYFYCTPQKRNCPEDICQNTSILCIFPFILAMEKPFPFSYNENGT